MHLPVINKIDILSSNAVKGGEWNGLWILICLNSTLYKLLYKFLNGYIYYDEIK